MYVCIIQPKAIRESAVSLSPPLIPLPTKPPNPFVLYFNLTLKGAETVVKKGANDGQQMLMKYFANNYV